MTRETAEQAGRGEDSDRGGKEKGEGNRERTGSMRWMEWLVRPKGSSSTP